MRRLPHLADPKRRPNRKCLMPSVSSNPPPAKKLRKVTDILSQSDPTLTTLPYVVTTNFLLYMEVETLENLSSTCSFFDQMIAGKFLTSINFPFRVNFISEVRNADCLDKKPLLKLRCKKVFLDWSDTLQNQSLLYKIITCTLNIFPVMEGLKEVTVKFSTNNCSYWKSEANDRDLHRAGLCCVNIGAMYKNCPNMEMFMGINVGMIDQKQPFNKWNMKIKKIFYEYCQNKGGSKELKT
jgi:hypothetical protein